MRAINSRGFSRVPVFVEGDPANIVGYLLVKDLIEVDPDDLVPIAELDLCVEGGGERLRWEAGPGPGQWKRRRGKKKETGPGPGLGSGMNQQVAFPPPGPRDGGARTIHKRAHTAQETARSPENRGRTKRRRVRDGGPKHSANSKLCHRCH